MHVIEKMILKESSVAFSGIVLNALCEGKLKRLGSPPGLPGSEKQPFQHNASVKRESSNPFLLPREKYYYLP